MLKQKEYVKKKVTIFWKHVNHLVQVFNKC